jgi:hypothetical protein
VYSTDLIWAIGILRSMPSSPATTMSVCELATTVPGTLLPSFKRTNACGPTAGEAAAGASTLGVAVSVPSFFAHEDRTNSPVNARNAMPRLMNRSSSAGVPDD